MYFLFTYILENYLVEQENFDPSLVPVSSIVTLAKVAQKLVNGNGTLTNPGNLQIGKDMQATGALTVTGKTAIGSTTMGDKTLNVTGTLGVSGKTVINSASIPSTLAADNYPDLAVGGSMEVTGNSSVWGDLDVTGTTELNKPLTIKSGDEYGNTLNLLQGTGATGEPPYINFMKNDGTTRNTYIMGKPNEILVDQNLTVGGNTKANTISSNQFNSTDSAARIQFFTDGKNYYNSGTGNLHHFRGNNGGLNGNVLIDGTATINGNTTVSGNLCIGSTCINESQLKILTGQQYFTLTNQHDENRDIFMSDAGDGRGNYVVLKDKTYSDWSRFNFKVRPAH